MCTSVRKVVAEKDVICQPAPTKRIVFLCQCRWLCVMVAAVNKRAMFTLANDGIITSNGEFAASGHHEWSLRSPPNLKQRVRSDD